MSQNLAISLVTFMTRHQSEVWKWMGLEVWRAQYHRGIKGAANKSGDSRRYFQCCGKEPACSSPDLSFHLPYLQPGSQILQRHQEQTNTRKSMQTRQKSSLGWRVEMAGGFHSSPFSWSGWAGWEAGQ